MKSTAAAAIVLLTLLAGPLRPLVARSSDTAPAQSSQAQSSHSVPMMAEDPGRIPADVTLTPTVTVTGGTAEQETIVELAVARFTDSGLPLPNLELRVLDGCSGGQGRYVAAEAVIELCVINEFLVLHELSHAWEHAHLTDADRHRFVAETRAETWHSSDTAWKNRGIEIMANSMATALMSIPLPAGTAHDAELANFEAVTGKVSPRLDIRRVTTTWEIDREAREDAAAQQAAYAEWRRTQAR